MNDRTGPPHPTSRRWVVVVAVCALCAVVSACGGDIPTDSGSDSQAPLTITPSSPSFTLPPTTSPRDPNCDDPGFPDDVSMASTVGLYACANRASGQPAIRLRNATGTVVFTIGGPVSNCMTFTLLPGQATVTCSEATWAIQAENTVASFLENYLRSRTGTPGYRLGNSALSCLEQIGQLASSERPPLGDLVVRGFDSFRTCRSVVKAVLGETADTSVSLGDDILRYAKGTATEEVWHLLLRNNVDDVVRILGPG